jgi:uncharacterized lipoprotein YmbA
MMCRVCLWITLLMDALCVGCYSGGANYLYYTLPSVQDPTIQAEDEKTGRLVIGLGPVALPRYLDRVAIVTRVTGTRLAVNDGHRWAGSLHSDIVRVLAANLERHRQVKEVVVFPWTTRIEPDLRFRVEIKAFEGGPGDNVTLKAAWSLTPAQPNQVAVRRISSIQEKTNGNGIEGLVTAMGSALSGLSREMSGAFDKAAP